MKSLFSAISFLTIFPVIKYQTNNQEHLKFSWTWFPLVGLLVGTIIGTVFEISYLYLHLSKLLSATLAISASIIITRGFHYDGLADTTDALFGGSNKESRLRIMKDPHIGSFAVLALICTILLQIQFITNIPTYRIIPTLGAIGLFSRLAVLPAMLWSPYANNSSLGLVFKNSLLGYIAVFLVSIGIGYFLIGQSTIYIPLLTALTALAISALAKRLLGGITGDICGCIIVISELVAMFYLSLN